MSYNKKSHLRQNIDAIKLSFQLDKEKRQATPEEAKILSAYSGFGGIKAVLNAVETPEDINKWAKSETDLFPMIQELHGVLRDNTESPEQYKQYVNSLKTSILSAFYTPKPVVDVLTNSISGIGINPLRVLEPSAGSGAFISSLKETLPESQITGFEKDLITGKILSHLHPDEQIRIEGYEKMEERYLNHFDVIASNIPFGDVAVFDPLFANHKNQSVSQGGGGL